MIAKAPITLYLPVLGDAGGLVTWNSKTTEPFASLFSCSSGAHSGFGCCTSHLEASSLELVRDVPSSDGLTTR